MSLKMDPRPDLFLAGMAKGSGCDFIRSVLAPSFQQYFEGLTGSGVPETEPTQTLIPGCSDKLRQPVIKDVVRESRNDSKQDVFSVSTQTDPIRNEAKFDPISIFYESIQTAPSVREISARVRAECTKEHRIALEQALQSLTAEHKLALNAITNVLNAERNARAAEREHYEADRRVMLAEQKRLEDATKTFASRQEDLAQRELAVQAREADLSSMTKQILSREETIATVQAENRDLQARIADLQSVIDSSNDQRKAADNEMAVMQRRIIALEETLKLYESVARYYSSQVGMPGAPAPMLPPCLPFPPTADSHPTGHFRQLQNAPPDYSPFTNTYLPEPPINMGPSPNMNYESGLSDEGNSGNYQGSQDNNYLRQQQHQASRPISHFNPGTVPPPMYSNPRYRTQGQHDNHILRQLQQFEDYSRPFSRPTADRQSQFHVPPNPNLIYQGTPAPELQAIDPAADAHGACLASDIYLSDPRSDATPLKDSQQPNTQTVGYSVFPIIDGFSPSRASTLQTTVRPGSAPPCGELPDRPSYKSTMSVKAFGDSKIGSISHSKAQVHALEEAFSESPDPVTQGCNALSPINRDLSGRTSLSKFSERSNASDPAVDVGRYSDSLQKSPIKQQAVADDSFKSSSPIRKSVTIVEATAVNGSALKEGSYQYSMTFDESAHSDLAASRQLVEQPRSQLSTSVHTALNEEKQPSAAPQKTVTLVTAGGMTYTVHHSPTNSTSASAMDQKSAYENVSYANDFDDFSDVGLRTGELAANNADSLHTNSQGGGISRSPSTNLYGELGPVEIAFDDF
ncbi:Hypothetical protein DHA2_150789 [Giardia duodenalis]|uniref:Uncharacterized protein n=1 Tax=Giardia intestinalis TaxID=5741 RepID=V6TI26_GIAIN|nr:Hypothetical protein DHA2_150789 [Giardia intestinalis]